MAAGGAVGTMARTATKRRKPAGKPDRSLAAAIVQAPRLSTPAEARARVAAWLGEIGRSAAGKALKRRIGAFRKLADLLAGLAEGSPFLWELATSDPDRLLAVLDADPDTHLRNVLTTAAKAVGAAKSEAAAMRALRRMKAEAALLIALADIGGVWPVMQTTGALTGLADTAVGAAVRFLLREAASRGRLKPAEAARPEQGSGFIVLAMGKMGAFELNYSSDIDLIVFYDPDAPALLDKDEASAIQVRITRGLVRLLQERTADGYVFRVDLRLRPDPASTQIAVSTEAALNYYGSVGQNWERAALIKARVCAGDIAAGDAILRQLSPFIWRKYLDYAAVADIEAMKRQIHAFRGHQDIAVEGHNIKLGRGGIREIEFFAQTQQLIAGGRHPELRGRDTLATLDALAARRLDRRRRPRRACRGLLFSPHHRAPAADGGRRPDSHSCRRSARTWSASRALPASRIATRWPRRCSTICGRCSGTMCGCSRTPRRAAISRRWRFP